MTSDPTTVLVIEDDPVQNKLYGQILEKAGYKVSLHTSAKKLFDEIDSCPLPNLILTDINLPDLDGLTFMHQLQSHSRWCDIPVVVMTAEPTRDRVIFSQKVAIPPEGFLVKPVTPAQMIQVIQHVLAKEQPIFLLRSLQRHRLKAQLSLVREQETIERSMHGAVKAIEECNTRTLEARKELQVVQRSRSLLTKESAETQQKVAEQIHRLEETISSLKTQIASYESERREIFSRRHELVLTHQREMKALEERIRAVAEVVRLGASSSSRAA